ncbi:MAG: twin-arginine translocase TatA/TatE family subunit [Acidobacteriota bacterium]
MVFLILESLGSTELIFILVMALVFFGPRKLPQLSRTLGKNLASFRRASEDFKQTWDREVNLEELNLSRLDLDSSLPANNSILENHDHGEPWQPSPPPIVEAVDADSVVPRESKVVDAVVSSDNTSPVEPPEPLSKRDWL